MRRRDVGARAANRSRSWEAENFKKLGRLGKPSLLIRAILIFIFIKAVQKYIFLRLFTNKKSNNFKLLLQIFLFTSMNLYLVNKNNKFLINFKNKGKFFASLNFQLAEHLQLFMFKSLYNLRVK